MSQIQKLIENYEPVGTMLMVEGKKVADRSAGGIIIPETARGNLNQGTVLKVGPQLDPNEWAPGMRVIWTEHTQNKLKVDDEEVILVDVANVVLRSLIKPAAGNAGRV